MFSNVLHSNGCNGALAMAPLVSNGYANHLYEELAMFETEDFVAQTYVQFKCQSISKKGSVAYYHVCLIVVNFL